MSTIRKEFFIQKKTLFLATIVISFRIFTPNNFVLCYNNEHIEF